jgi:MerR family transcriptional regulator, thiopeptide resistance regulator
LSRSCRVHEFAELAGVTVKALHHYDRLGLLKPRRTAAGYRVYFPADLERLEQIVALKFLGLPLKQIKSLLDRDALQLPNALRLQRRELQHKRRLMDRAIRALEDAEKIILAGKPIDSLVLKKIIEVIGMQSNTDFMRKYYSEEAWAKWTARHKHWPSEEWIELLGEIQQSLGTAPESDAAQALVARWLNLRDNESGGDPTVLAGLMKSWVDREQWPADVYQKISKFDLEGIARFISEASVMYRRKYYSDEAWAKFMAQSAPGEHERRALEWFDLYLEIGASLDDNPAGEKAQSLAERWRALTQQSINDDPGLRAGALKGWADHENWPAALRQELELFQFKKIVAFIGKANAAYGTKYFSEDALRKRMDLASAPGSAERAAAWSVLHQDVRAALGEDPGSEKAQVLARRWMELVEESTGGDSKIKLGSINAWQDRKNWPAWRQDYVASIEAIAEFIGRAIDWPLKKYFTEEAWMKRREHVKSATPEQLAQGLHSRTELFSDIAAALGEDPAGDKARALKARWLHIRANEAGSDPDLLAGSSKAWADRRNWSVAIRLREATSYGMTVEQFYEAAEFLDKIV